MTIVNEKLDIPDVRFGSRSANTCMLGIMNVNCLQSVRVFLSTLSLLEYDSARTGTGRQAKKVSRWDFLKDRITAHNQF